MLEYFKWKPPGGSTEYFWYKTTKCDCKGSNDIRLIADQGDYIGHYYGIVWDKYYYLFIQDASKLIDGNVCENLKHDVGIWCKLLKENRSLAIHFSLSLYGQKLHMFTMQGYLNSSTIR